MRSQLAGLLAVAALSAVLTSTAEAQISLQPTPPPTTTAENETWYLSGGPISYGGNLYYPAGAVTHFSRNEMVRTGTFGNSPIYVRTTQEPGSIIYVPLAGGLMRPYERRRTGDLAGTVGSSAPSFPVALPAETGQVFSALQAPAPPTGVPVGTTGFIPAPEPEPAPQPAPARVDVPSPVGTSGFMAPARTRIQTVQRPVGLNSVFVQFKGARWFSAGPAVEFSPDRFTQVGEHRGFPVYQEKGRAGVIYLSLLEGNQGLVAPYSTR